MIVITQQELLDALVTASEAPEDARTVVEMAEATGLSVKKVRAALHAFQRQGRLAVHQVRRVALDGRLAQVVGYTVRPV